MLLDKNHVAVISSVNVVAALAWCKENCPTYITNRYHSYFDDANSITYDFFFGDEKEALLCRLKWA
jgi:hypothetical protein